MTNYPQEPGDPRNWGGKRYSFRWPSSEETAWALVFVLALVVLALLFPNL
jgi:hypothetical protein